ncbi:MAG: hypothetical protein F9K27_14600 [Anaerolineae bacterium]|nr:MAG: hypothetical protein F9K27_14600 [Anaerolineae bacterium]
MAKKREVELSFRPYFELLLGYDLFSAMTPGQAKKYLAWFIEQIPLQIHDLEAEVRASKDEYRSWSADKSAESLNILGIWFQSQSHLRQMTAQEVDRFYARMTPRQRSMVAGTDNTILDEKTVLASIKTGMYLGEVLRENLKGTYWTLVTKPKSDIHYHQPVLGGFKQGHSCNPVMMASFFAMQLAENRGTPDQLRNIYYEGWTPHVEDKNELKDASE